MLFDKKVFLLAVGISLIMLNNRQVCGEGDCDISDAGGKELDTFLSGFERMLLGLDNVAADVIDGITGGDDGDSPIFDTFSTFLEKFSGQVHAILPGTLWCGPGNVSIDGNETLLGPYEHTDACCRSHDECHVVITAGEQLGPLKNNGGFTRLVCGCDHAFYQCLKRANSPISNALGNTYFNVLRPQCFTCEYPIVGCAEQDSTRLFDSKCVEYELDSNQNKTFQWFDNPDF